jgi:PAS domain S-box-containing protein
MQFELWGAIAEPYLTLPDRPVGYILLALYLLILVLVLIRQRNDARRFSSRTWLLVIGLALASLITSQLFPVTVSSEGQLPPLSRPENPEATLLPFAFVPFLLAGAILNPLAAIVVGFFGGVGLSLWQTHEIYDPFHYAFAALLATWLMQQNYSGHLYRLLRHPVVSGIFAGLLIAPLVGIASFAYSELSASNMAALDVALSTSGAYMLPLVIQGVIGGLIVALILIGLPNLRRQQSVVPSPLNRSLNMRLVATFLIFAVLLSFALIVVGFNLAMRLSSDLAIEQMAHDAQSVSSEIPDFRSLPQNMLVQASLEEELLDGDSEQVEAILRRTLRSGDFFRSVILADDSREVVAFYPPEEVSSESLTNAELDMALETLLTGAPGIGPALAVGNADYVIPFIVPVKDEQDEVKALLIGRTPDDSVQDLIVGLQGTLGQGFGFIVDELDQIIAHPDPATWLRRWTLPESGQGQLSSADGLPGSAFEDREGSTNARQLVYAQSGPDHPWTVVITMPYEVILGQALQISAQLAIVLFAAMLLFGLYLLSLGRSVTQPLADLARASQRIASGSLNTPVKAQGDDEIGRLGRSFGHMQISLKKRLDELSLLLDVSQDVSKNIDISRGMPSILKGALRGTGAAGVRVVVINPSGRHPLTFGEGPGSESMSSYDRQIRSLLSQHEELILSTPVAVSSVLAGSGDNGQFPKALIALPLAIEERFQGIFWLTYRGQHHFDQTELSFLRTLASQASVLVENARLYATAEGGRRRLAAVLSSTSDAVIVTDQTERVLLVNPAMERFFDMRADKVVGRPVKSVVPSDVLVKALTSSKERTHNLEVPNGSGRVFYASASTIFNNEGLAMGRVAVLHDITYLKEIDDLKSEFVATVSHDLRSPLTFMLGYATMLSMTEGLDVRQREYVGKILGGIEQMSELINDLLDLGRLEAGVDLVRSHFRIRELLESIVEEHQQPARANGVELTISVSSRLPLAYGDSSLIRQAVANLVSNAIKYAPNSGRVVLGAIVNGPNLVVSVKDSGPGISKEDQLRLFEKFYRVHHQDAANVKGTGLGLALVKSIAFRHGGRTWCESRLGKGSTFYLSLPLDDQP